MTTTTTEKKGADAPATEYVIMFNLVGPWARGRRVTAGELYRFYAHGKGASRPGDEEITECVDRLVALGALAPAYD
jgi:hypothetical protein